MKKINLFFVAVLSFSACGFEYRTHEFDTTIKITDIDGKPQKDVVVDVTVCNNSCLSPDGIAVTQSKKSDSEGILKLNYTVTDDESSADKAHLRIVDELFVVAVTKTSHSVGGEQGKQKFNMSYNFLVDSLRSYKIRVQKTAATSLFTGFTVRKSYSAGKTTIDSVNRNFLSWASQQGSFDSTFVFKAYAKMPFTVSGGNTTIQVQPKLVKSDSVFLIKL